MYNLFELYVDPMVDRIPSNIGQILGIIPPDESLLKEVFEKNKYTTIDKFGVKIMLPNPEVLLSTKLTSFPNRTKDHKRIKDLADVYALIWHSGVKMKDLQAKVSAIIGTVKITQTITSITDEEYEQASNAIGVDKTRFTNVIKGFIPKTTSHSMNSDDKDSIELSDDKWRTPFNVSFDTLKIIINSFYRKQADQKYVTTDDIVKTSGLNQTGVSSNILFLKSIKLIEGDNQTGFKFTQLGTDYAKSISMNDETSIKKLTVKIVENSHLKDLHDYIMVRQNEITLDKIYQYVKTTARISNGISAGNMPAPYGTGVKALLTMLDVGGLLPANVSEELNSRKKYDSKNSANKKTKKSSNTNEIKQTKSMPQTELKEGVLGRISVNGVGYVDIKDNDTLELAKSYLEILKKKLTTDTADN